jgi:hypothetical protein
MYISTRRAGRLKGPNQSAGAAFYEGNQTGTSAMKNFMHAGAVLVSLTAGSLPLANVAAAQPYDQGDYRYYSYPYDSYRYYSYRHHYRAYGINSLYDGSLPPDEVYIDPCYRWVNTPRGWLRKLVCRS